MDGFIISSLNKEMLKRDVVNNNLQKFYHNSTAENSNEMKNLKAKFQQELERADKVFLEQEARLLARNKHLMQEVSELNLYRRMRHNLQLELDHTKRIIEENEKHHVQQLAELERKFDLAKEALQKEAEDRIAHSRKVYKEEVGKELDYESKLVRKANAEMEEELAFHESRTEDLLQSNQALELEAAAVKSELKQTNLKEHERSLRGIRQQKQLATLKSKIQSLEQALANTVRSFEQERNESRQKHLELVSTLARKIKQHEQLAELRDKELKSLRTHAGALLKHRNDLEVHFFEAIEQVKAELMHDWSLAQRTNQALQGRQLDALGSESGPIANSNGRGSAGAGGAPRKATLRDFNKEHRDRVLRLVFAKLNQAAAQPKPAKAPMGLGMEDDCFGGNKSKTASTSFGNGGLTFLTDMDLLGN